MASSTGLYCIKSFVAGNFVNFVDFWMLQVQNTKRNKVSLLESNPWDEGKNRELQSWACNCIWHYMYQVKVVTTYTAFLNPSAGIFHCTNTAETSTFSCSPGNTTVSVALLHICGSYYNTVDTERFAGLNICGFNPIEVFVEILLHCFG